jgi:hypothetical protein
MLQASEIQHPPPWQENPPIVTIKKELYKKSPRPGAAALVAVSYVGPKLERREWQGIEVLDDVHEQQVARWSMDNGRTWSPFQRLQPSSNVTYKGITVWEGSGCQLYDPRPECLVEMWLRQIVQQGVYHNFTYFRFSRDFGRTWTLPKQLRYEPGEDFDPENPRKPGFLKTNQAYFGNNLLRASNGTLVHAVAHANAPGDPENDRRPWKMGSLCFIGTWDRDRQDFVWKPGKRVEIAPAMSSRGLMEPEVAEMTDHRILVIWRGSNTAKTPGRKWFSLSRDGGHTLEEVRELKYDDGTRFFSPSSYHRMIRHSVSKKLYWIGNICAAPPQGNSPRHPLVIAEVEETISALKRRTVTALDDRRSDQPGAIQFSNFSLLENRETHDLELHLTTYGQDAKSVYTADNYKYTLTLK